MPEWHQFLERINNGERLDLYILFTALAKHHVTQDITPEMAEPFFQHAFCQINHFLTEESENNSFCLQVVLAYRLMVSIYPASMWVIFLRNAVKKIEQQIKVPKKDCPPSEMLLYQKWMKYSKAQ